jgi:hypothetical protein
VLDTLQSSAHLAGQQDGGGPEIVVPVDDEVGGQQRLGAALVGAEELLGVVQVPTVASGPVEQDRPAEVSQGTV